MWVVRYIESDICFALPKVLEFCPGTGGMRGPWLVQLVQHVVPSKIGPSIRNWGVPVKEVV